MDVKLLPPEEAFKWPEQAIRDKAWIEAAKRWAVLREVYPQHPATWCRAASAHIEAEEWEQADALLASARQKFPHNPNSFLQSAELSIRQERWDSAECYLSQARKQFSDSFLVWMKSVECARQKGDLEQAELYNKKARQSASGEQLTAVFIQYAELAMCSEEWEKALERWSLVRDLSPERPVGYLRAAEAARQLGRFKEARQLTLAQQYGDDVFVDDQSDHPRERREVVQGGHARLGGLVELIWTKALFNLRSEVQRNYLSYGWWVLEPLLHMIVYYVVFGLLLSRGEQNIPSFC